MGGMSDSLAREIVAFFRDERQPVPVYSLAKEYSGMSKLNTAWQAATSVEAIAAIRRAAELGLVEIRNEVVYPVSVVKVDEKQDTQMELF